MSAFKRLTAITESIIRTPVAPGRFSPFERMLRVLSMGYGFAVRCRATLYRKRTLPSRRLPCPVVSIGNLTMGGTGKTPMAMYTARLLQQMGYRVAIVSRGYRGSAEKSGGLVSDGKRRLMGPEAAGDEPFMMAGRLPGAMVAVGRDRYAAGMKVIERFRPDVVVLDDGFQHLRLFRDIDLVLLDGRDPFGNGYCLPRGMLREPISAIRRADACILTRSDLSPLSAAGSQGFLNMGKPVFRSVHVPRLYERCRETGSRFPKPGPEGLSPMDPGALNGRAVFAFSGVADNGDFRRTVEGFGPQLKGFCGFPDHYPYTVGDLEQLCRKAAEAGAGILVTTEKDYARLGHRIRWTGTFWILGIEPSFGSDTDRFGGFIQQQLGRVIGNTGEL